MKIILAASILLTTLWLSLGSDRYHSNTRTVDLGELQCRLLLKTTDQAIATLVALHPNEKTCTEVMDELPRDVRFNLAGVEQEEKRLLKFRRFNQDLWFDPNRIFTNTGLRKNLQFHNNSATADLEQDIQSFSDTLISFIQASQTSPYIVAVHNNSDENFSILSYQDTTEAVDVFINPEEDVDNFILVTQPQDFAFFKRHNINTALLANSLYEDDGSLSVYCLQNGFPYINIEVEHGNKQKQIQLLILTYDLLKQKNAFHHLEPAPQKQYFLNNQH
ncbi:MAG: hypothetical protein SFV52_16720 [Saprospiraceae bacterium]|nr:hypothetical protein [Saprospiraceae bacterium]